MNDLHSLVQIKGLRDGLLVSLTDAPWEDQQSALLSQMDQQPSFFQGARLALDVGAQILHVNEMVELRDQLSDRNVVLWAVVSKSPTTEADRSIAWISDAYFQTTPGGNASSLPTIRTMKRLFSSTKLCAPEHALNFQAMWLYWAM